jgi:hypothetical protein
MTYACPAWEFVADSHLLKSQRLQNSPPHDWQLIKAHTDPRFMSGVQIPYVRITKICRKQAEVIQNHKNVNVRNISQSEAQHRKCKRLKLGGGQAYDRSSIYM